MNLERFSKKLGLPNGATESEIIQAIEELQKRNSNPKEPDNSYAAQKLIGFARNMGVITKDNEKNIEQLAYSAPCLLVDFIELAKSIKREDVHTLFSEANTAKAVRLSLQRQ